MARQKSRVMHAASVRKRVARKTRHSKSPIDAASTLRSGSSGGREDTDADEMYSDRSGGTDDGAGADSTPVDSESESEPEDESRDVGESDSGVKKPSASRKRGNSGVSRSRSRAKDVNYTEQESSVGTDDFGETDMDGDVDPAPSDGEAETDEMVAVGGVQVPIYLLGDLISSYLVLRAFSWQLKLSPFPLEAFVRAVVYERPNRMIDEVHVCLLRALAVDEAKAERHERALDLEHLDFVTWPSFVWEWLVRQGYSFRNIEEEGVEEEEYEEEDVRAAEKGHKAGKRGGKIGARGAASKRGGGRKRAGGSIDDADIPQEEVNVEMDVDVEADENVMKRLFGGRTPNSGRKGSNPEYHALSLDIKISVLHALCDSLLDRPFIRAEMDRREEAGEVITGIGGVGGQFAMMTPDEMEDAMAKAKEDGQMDLFSESCVLCGLGGVLLCCDSCPAAYHTRCAGEEGGFKGTNKSQKWRCPECLVGGRGETAGLRLAVAGRVPGGRVYTFNGAALRSHAAHVDGTGVTASERSDGCTVRILYGDEAKHLVGKMQLPKKQRLDPTSMEAVGNLYDWPEDDLPTEIEGYVNRYSWGWIATAAALRSHVEDLRKRRSSDKLWVPHGTVAKAPVVELPAPMGISLYEWQPMRPFGGPNVNATRCGKCYSCLRPNLRKPCMDPVKKVAAEDRSLSKLRYVSALLAKMEREFWPLAEKEWDGPDGGHVFRNKWIAGLKEATTAEEVARLMLQLEAALRPTCFRANWYKYYPSALMPGGVGGAGDDPEEGPFDGNDTSRSRDQYDIGSDMSISDFSKSKGGEWEEKRVENAAAPSGSKKLRPPKFLVRQAVLNAGRKPIPGVRYRQGNWRMNNDRLKWISEVEGCKTISDLAITIRKLEDSLRWDSATQPRFAVDDISVCGKRLDDEGNVSYALLKTKEDDRRDGPGDGEGNEAEEEEDPDAVPATAVWATESSIPLWVIKSYEEAQRRQLARETIQAMHGTRPLVAQDGSASAAGDSSTTHLCGMCYNTNESHAKSPFTPKCKVCLREFHGLCLVMGDDDVRAAREGKLLTKVRASGQTGADGGPKAEGTQEGNCGKTEESAMADEPPAGKPPANVPGEWICVGCTANDKLIARLIKTARAGQHLPGTAFCPVKRAEIHSPPGKKPGRPPKPFFERSDYTIGERKELLRRLKAAKKPELFDVEVDDRFNLNPSGNLFLETDLAGQSPTNCPVCRYPDLGRPLIPCSGCSREFHRECFGIVSMEPHHWNAKTIKCAECLGKRVRAPAESVILAAIEAAQEPPEDAASIQDRVKQRAQRARHAKEAQIAEDAKKANWMEAADRVLTRVYRMQVAQPFRFPVPTEVLTDYTNYVDEPMDLETIRDDLYTYESPLDVVKRMKLIADNCLAYNGADAKVSGQAEHMMKSFMRIWKKEGLPLPGDDIAPGLLAKVGGSGGPDPKEDDAPYLRVAHLLEGEPAPDWMRRIGKVFGQLGKLQCVEPFLRPVPKGYANYHEIIRRPMDFSTIKAKMNEGKYLDPSQVLLDVDLIWENCARFNHPDAPIIQDLHESKAEFEKLWVDREVMVPVGNGVVIKKDDIALDTGAEWLEPARSVLYRVINFCPPASWFYEPVDEREVPGYRSAVERPICIKQISEQLNSGTYTSTNALWADVEQIVRNSEAFNGPDDEVTEGARQVLASFKKYWKNLNMAPPSDDSLDKAFFETEWISSSLACIDSVVAHPLADPFAAPVNERSAPGYSKVVKRPMDFSTIKYNLEKGSYQSALQVAEDISLIFQNCRAYNPAGDEIRAMGTMVEAMIRSKWENAELPIPKKWRKR